MQFLRGIKNPQQFIFNMLGQNQTPMGVQLMNLAKTGDKTQIENFARNICKERNIDFDKQFAEFMKQING
ncbi:MAG: hypothetical protein ACLS59_06775 [Clostridia bacterium]